MNKEETPSLEYTSGRQLSHPEVCRRFWPRHWPRQWALLDCAQTALQDAMLFRRVKENHTRARVQFTTAPVPSSSYDSSNAA